jgi:hypothetical protein
VTWGAPIDLFCFASKNVENIRRGIEARKWAVATVSTSAMKGRITKAQRYFHSGSLGLLYCRETHFFTTPFIAITLGKGVVGRAPLTMR